MAASNKIFRAEALEQLNSPEQLEQLLKVTDRKAWISLITIAVLLISAIVWSLIGQIPMTVDGVGILIYPRQVVPFQSPASGQVAVLNVQVGDSIREGDIIGTIDQPSITSQLKAEQERLAELTARNEQVADLSGRRGEMEKEAIARQREMLESRIVSTREAADLQLENSKTFMQSQLQNVDNVLATQRTLEANLRERYQTFLQLQKEGLSSNDIVLNAKQRLIDNQVKTSELKLRRQEIELGGLQADEAYSAQMSKVAEMEAQLQELTIQENQLVQRGLESTSDRELQMQATRSKIEQLQESLNIQGTIISEHTGKILELTMREGQIVQAGSRIGSIETTSDEDELLGLAYLRVGDGKKVKPGMDIRISPSTVERERHGSIEAVVAEVTPFPVTSDAVATVIGSREIARELMQNTTKIQITSTLKMDEKSVSGFKWTSGTGPPDTITAGTTAAIRATIEYRRPITFAIPLLRKWTGV